MRSSFFEWLHHYEYIYKFKKGLDENVMALMELMHQPWDSIMMMPYKFFLDCLKWKIELEEEKTNRLNEARGKGRTKKITQRKF